MSAIYLDNNATTQPDPRVVDAMLPYLREGYANPSSLHLPGQQVRHAIEVARGQVAALLHSQARRIVFTSGGTESNHLAIRGVLGGRPKKRHIVTTAVEHDCVLRLCEQLEREGYEVTRLGVDHAGRLDPDAVEAAIRPDTALLSIMHANNETGVIFPIAEVGEIARRHGVPLHVDAAQSAGKIPIDIEALPVDLLSLAAHKLHGPKGVGALYVRRGLRLRPLLLGGRQEHDLRAGTENVPGIVGFGVAAELAVEHLAEEDGRVRALRDRLETRILGRIPYAQRFGDADARLPNTASIGFATLEAEAILLVMSNHGICVSSGSACSSGSLEPSHVLQAMGLEAELIHGAVRFSLSRFTTADEIDHVVAVLPELLDRLGPLTTPPRPLRQG
ncbi:MAG: cysteine desulfurase NifS [Phycisphaerae bacterium]|nr:cysteine desulfurase NifS [Phycisphaerae bacterium]